MSQPAKTMLAGRKRLKWAISALSLLAGAVTLFLWFSGVTIGDSDPQFRGKPESEWIKNLKYSDNEQVKEWRTYGEEGVQVLIRGLERANRPGEKAYRRVYRRLPGFVMRWLPSPKDDSTRAKRMELVSLLSSLGNDARSATSVMIWTVTKDEDDSVRHIAILFFTSSEDDKCLLNQLPVNEKAALLPALIRSIQSPQDWALRNNAAIALRYYPEQRAIIAPILTNALFDPQPQVVLVAAAALNRVAPDLITNVGVVPIVTQILKNPDDQIAHWAAKLLGEMKAEPLIAVPALIEAMKSTNRLVATDSTLALTKFDQPAELILPALDAARQRNDLSPRTKTAVQKKIETMAVAGKGLN